MPDDKQGSNLDSNLDSAALPTSCKGFIWLRSPWINCVGFEFRVRLESVEDAEIEASKVNVSMPKPKIELINKHENKYVDNDDKYKNQVLQ